jgi:hypothetical protein
VNTFNKPSLCLYDEKDEKIYTKPIDFEPIDELLSIPRVKRTPETTTLSKYPLKSLLSYRRNMMATAAFSAASVATVAFLIVNSQLLRELLGNSGNNPYI